MSTLKQGAGTRGVILSLIFWIAPVWAVETGSAPGETNAQGETVDCFYQQHAAHPACQKESKQANKEERNQHGEPGERQTADALKAERVGWGE
jgi:hypothetical protein